MGASLLPPRGVFVPTWLLFDKSLPPVVRDTLVQLMALAWSNAGHELPPVSFLTLSGLTGKSISTLHSHFAILRDQHAALRLRSVRNGLFIVTMADMLFEKRPLAVKKTDFWNLENGKLFSGNLESTLKESDQEEEDSESYLPPPLVKSLEEAEKNTENGFSPRLGEDLEAELIEAGVFSFLLPEVARAGWQEADLRALLAWCREDSPDKPGGVFMVRLRSQAVVPDRYYGEACDVCGRVGKHAADCRRRYAVDEG